MNHNTISCQLHDYVEIACLYDYRVRLILKNRRIIEGRAVDILTSPDKREYLIIDDGRKRRIELTTIKRLEALTANAQFNDVVFD